jgi:hypothetical protein
MKAVTCAKFLAAPLIVAFGIASLLLSNSLPDNGSEITGSISVGEPAAAVRVTEDIFAHGSAELVPLPEPAIPAAIQPAGSQTVVKVATAKKKRKSKYIDGPSLSGAVPPPV